MNTYLALHDHLSDAIEKGRVTRDLLPDDYDALVSLLVDASDERDTQPAQTQSADLFPLPDFQAEVGRIRDAFEGVPVIGIHATARSGKDEVSKVLQANEFLYSAFSTRGKAAAQQAFGLTDEQTWSDHAKEMVVPHLNMTPREIFQRFLTEVCRGSVSDDLWIRNAFRDAAATVRKAELSGHPYKGVVFQDVRTEPEAAAVRAIGGQIWHLRRHTAAPSVTEDGAWRATDSTHSSEAGVALSPGEPMIFNDSTLDALHERVRTELAPLLRASNEAAVRHSSPGM